MAGKKLEDVFKKSVFSRHESEGKEFSEGITIDFPSHGRIRDDGLQFRGEIKRLGCLAIIERFDADAIARQKEPPAPGIPDRKGKHPAQFTHAFWPQFFVQMNDDFSVRMRAKHMPFGEKLFTQFLKIVNLAVEDDPNCLILVGHRLRPRAQINNGQAEVSKPGDAIQVNPLPVWSPMSHRAKHVLNIASFDPRRRIKEEFAGNATHILKSDLNLISRNWRLLAGVRLTISESPAISEKSCTPWPFHPESAGRGKRP